MTFKAPEYDPQRELREHLSEEEWREAMRVIGERHALAGGPEAPFATGSDVVWGVGGAVVKLTAPAWDWQIEAEAQALERVTGRLSVGTPEWVARGSIDGWPYLVMTRLSGVPLAERWKALSPGERAKLAHELGALTRELHGLEVADLDRPWEPFWEECWSRIPGRHAEEGVPAALVEAMPAFLTAAGFPARGLAKLPPPVFLHTELLDQHVLVGESGGELALAGLIDFADWRVGPAEYDFPAVAEFVLRGEAGLWGSFLDGYGFEEAERGPDLAERLLAWSLCHRYGRLKRALACVGHPPPGSLPALAQRLYRP